MHYYGRSDILDKLYDGQMKREPDPVHYDVRSMSRELLARTKNGQPLEWKDSTGADVKLEKTEDAENIGYELYYREKDDQYAHYFSYKEFAKRVIYDYPFGTHHLERKAEETILHIESILLTGPITDKVPDSLLENRIQKAFSSIAAKLVMENLVENAPELRIEKFTEYILAHNTDVKETIITQLYEKSRELNTFTLGPKQFENAFHADLREYREKQKRIVEKPTTEEVIE
jgi:hypothetical protein